ncbi:TPA: cytochrome P450, partial [Acinetobacter baumannii]
MNSVAEIFEKITQTVTSTAADVATTVTDKVKSNEQFQTGKQFLHGQVTRFVPLHTQVRGIQWMQKAKFRVFNVQEFPAFIEQPIPEVATLALAEIDVSNPFLYK